MTAVAIGDDLHVVSPIEIIRPCWLVAVGDSDRLEVFRSPLVREDDSWFQPVREFIKDHGLALAARETFDDEHWMFGEVEMSVYVSQAVRNNVYAGKHVGVLADAE